MNIDTRKMRKLPSDCNVKLSSQKGRQQRLAGNFILDVIASHVGSVASEYLLVDAPETGAASAAQLTRAARWRAAWCFMLN